jgi:hypothetical protein
MPTVREVMEHATLMMLVKVDLTGWPEHPGQAEPWDINRGRCVEWAELVCAGIPGAQMHEYDDCAPTWMLHTFVRLGGLYYDAEALGGVKRVRELPCFSHPWERGKPEDLAS